MTMPEAGSGGLSDRGTERDQVLTANPSEAGADEGSGGRGQFRQVRDQVVDQARTTFREARDRAGSSLADSRRQAADQIGGLAGAFHRTSEHLRDEQQERIAELADSFANQVDQVARYLREADLRTVGRDVERLARERPVVVYGAAFAVGLLAARFLKSSDAGGRGIRRDEDLAGYERIRPGGEPAGLGGYGRSDLGGFDASA
jgi:rhodanese-related sulfurtransferase